MAEKLEVPVSIVGWQLKTSGGWGQYLCLPLEAGSYTRTELAKKTGELLQSTVSPPGSLTWTVKPVRKSLQFHLKVNPAKGPPDSQESQAPAILGFRLAPSKELVQLVGLTPAEDGWIYSVESTAGTFISEAAPSPSSSPDVSAHDAPAAPAGQAGTKAGERNAVWRQTVRTRLLKEIGDFGQAAKQSSVHFYKMLQHPIASFGVALQVVVRREMEVIASCGGLR